MFWNQYGCDAVIEFHIIISLFIYLSIQGPAIPAFYFIGCCLLLHDGQRSSENTGSFLGKNLINVELLIIPGDTGVFAECIYVALP